MSTPLADRIRPQTLDDIVGQTHLLGPGKILRNIIESGQIPNMIFYGPSGVGKTTLARLIASQTNKKLFKLNGTSASTSDIKAIIDQVNTIASYNGILLYLDEIQYLNKKQQQSLLEHIENGDITLIASTTENPYFYIYNAILSRCTVFEFKAVEPSEVLKAVKRAFSIMEEELSCRFEMEEGVPEWIAQACGGDVRKSMNTVELCALSAQLKENQVRVVTLETAKELAQKSAMKYDRAGDEHYDLLSALQKSIRGSDPDAAVHYLGRLLEAGDLLSPCRRLLVIASEDIGMAYPMAIAIVKACVDSAVQLGLPEARIPLAEAAVLLATSPKSNSSYMAINRAMADIQHGKGGTFPRILQNMHYDGAEREVKGQHYQYPHDFPNHYVAQQYLPDDLAGTVYYEYGENKTEQAAKQYWAKIKKE
jgi:putative ATPase